MSNDRAGGLFETSIRSLPLVHRGKVRDSYAVGDDKLLIVTTDRLSAFDVVMGEPIADKGRVLNAMSLFWFNKLTHVIPNHLTGIDPVTVVAQDEVDQVHGRAVVAIRLKPVPIEAVVRGYLIGSGWKDYLRDGTVCGIRLASGLKLAAKLAQPIFTPADKAEFGQHDENISFIDVERRVGAALAVQLRDLSLALYRVASAYAATCGILIADTKFEFGIDAQGVLRLMDEVLTPDSSRFWPAEGWREGISPPSFDKQYVRDWLEQQPWDKSPPAPTLPAEVIAQTAQRYRQALSRLAGTDVV